MQFCVYIYAHIISMLYMYPTASRSHLQNLILQLAYMAPNCGVVQLLLVLLCSMALFVFQAALASDPGSVQDFCIAERNSPVFMNGLACKDAKLATAADFFFAGLDVPGNTMNRVGSNVSLVSAAVLPGMNTLGVSVARIDYAPYGVNPPHTHPRATEVLTVLEGTLYAGFVTSNPENRLFAKTLRRGDVYVFPVGLVHFQFNVGNVDAVAIAALSSQNPGVVTVANAVFGTRPPVADDVLTKAFGVDKEVIDELRAQFNVGS